MCLVSFSTWGGTQAGRRGRTANAIGRTRREGSNPSLPAKKSYLIFYKKYVIIYM